MKQRDSGRALKRAIKTRAEEIRETWMAQIEGNAASDPKRVFREDLKAQLREESGPPVRGLSRWVGEEEANRMMDIREGMEKLREEAGPPIRGLVVPDECRDRDGGVPAGTLLFWEDESDDPEPSPWGWLLAILADIAGWVVLFVFAVGFFLGCMCLWSAIKH